MGRYARRRNSRNFWENPLVNLCYVISVLAFVAGIFGLFALIGGAKCLPFTLIALAVGIAMFPLAKKLNARKKDGGDGSK